MSKPLSPVEEQQAKALATAMIAGSTITAAANAINIPLSTAKRISKSEIYRSLVEDIGESELGPALAKAKSKLAKLVDKAIRAVESNLDKDSLDAAKIVLKSVGLDQQEQKKDQDTNITVIMPSGNEPRTIEVDVE